MADPTHSENQSWQQQAKIKSFWDNQLQTLHNMQQSDIKKHELPVSRIKKIMKFDEDVKMVSQEVLDLFAKCCELFIKELTYRASFCTEHAKRKTIQKCDISTALNQSEIYDFLIDIVPREESKKETYSLEDMLKYSGFRGLNPDLVNSLNQLPAESLQQLLQETTSHNLQSIKETISSQPDPQTVTAQSTVSTQSEITSPHIQQTFQHTQNINNG